MSSVFRRRFIPVMQSVYHVLPGIASTGSLFVRSCRPSASLNRAYLPLRIDFFFLLCYNSDKGEGLGFRQIDKPCEICAGTCIHRAVPISRIHKFEKGKEYIMMNMNHGFCPLCGAVIPVDLSKEAMICPACGRPFINAQAITADPTPAPQTLAFTKKEFSTTPLSDLEIEHGVLLRYKGKNSYVILPDCIKEIGSNAFLAARNLRNVIMPDSITKIGAQAFSECRQLVKLRMPETVTLIGKGAFSGCKSLTAFTLPFGIQTVASDTFWGCTALKSIQFPPTLRRIETNAFHGCTALLSVEVPAGTVIADGAFPAQTSITQI